MTREMIRSICKAIALLTLAVGGAGSISCLPFAFSTDLRWIVAAGVYFVAGAIMITGGLATYIMLVRETK